MSVASSEVGLTPLQVMEGVFAAFETGDTEAAARLCSPDLVEHQFGLSGRGAEAVEHVQRAVAELHRTIPDLAFTIEDSVVDGDVIWVRVTARGTATGPFFGPPSGRQVELTVFDSARVVDGRSSSTGACRIVSPCWPRPASSTG